MDLGKFDLLPAEQLRWTGAPVRYPLFDGRDALLVPFSLIWTGFAVAVFSFGAAGGSFSLFEVPFLIVGAYMLVGRFVVRYLTLRNTRYAVTDQRVIIGGSRRERSAYLAELPPPELRERPDGSGTISLDESDSVSALLTASSGRRTNPFGTPFALIEIENARHVRDLIASGRATPRSAW